MPDKPVWTVQEGEQFTATFWPNPKPQDSQEQSFRFRAMHLDGRRAPKIVLCDDERIEPGKPCRIRIDKVARPESPRKGFIIAEYLSPFALGLNDTVYVDPVVARKLQALLELGKNVLLDGPQGCGKTVLSKHVAEVLGMEYVYFNASYVFDSIDFVASLQLRSGPQGHHETVWLPTDIYRAVQKAIQQPGHRCLVFLDELNRCREMARNGIMPALDGTRRIYDPFANSTIRIPKTIQWIAAVNTGSQFGGTTPIDAAQLDRFAPLKLTYPPVQAEKRLLAARHPDVPADLVELVVRIADRLRNDKNCRLPVSMRATEEVVAMLSHPLYADSGRKPLRELLQSSFCGRFTGHWQDPSTDAGAAWEIVEDQLQA